LSTPAKSTAPATPLASPPSGPFGLALVSSADGKPTPIDGFQPSPTCAECHPRQWQELDGSMHSIAHRDSLYRRTAELARVEAGEKVYTYCSSCHSPQGVTSGLIPATPEARLPEVVKAGVVCDTCHQIAALTGAQGPWGEPGNASFQLRPDAELKHGPPTGDDDAADHEVEGHDFYQKSEFCAGCHTVIHPLNGVRLEHTYAEWKESPYAAKGIQCQDCHMRTVAQARQVAATMKPIRPTGKSSPEGEDRPIGYHLFAGGNANAQRLGGGQRHADIAVERLRSAASLALELPARAAPARPLRLQVVVSNIGAGHSLPTSLTELREIWVELKVTAADGRLVFHSGALDRHGEIDPQAMRFGAKGGDAQGEPTYKPWEVTRFLWKRLIPAKGSARDEFSVVLPARLAGPLTVTAVLRYRSAPPALVRQLFADEPIELRVVEMARATKQVALGSTGANR
jgi:hypothetical protein